MPSPFPGMNPYLERSGVWAMFHGQFISACQQHLARQLRPKYVVKMETLVCVEKSRYLEIRDRSSDRLVTLIELLSPANKYAGPDRDQYIAKRSQILLSQAHLVEIDLLRGGPRMPVDGLPAGIQYAALVSRVSERPRVGLWSWRLRDAMPDLPIPVADGDPDAKLELKRTLDEVYDAGGYEDFIYSGPPEPRLGSDDTAWSEQFHIESGT